MDLSDLTFAPGVPVYLQTASYLKGKMISGRLADGDELPSRRVFAAMAGINPATVQKIYKQLEDEGLIETAPNALSTVTLSQEKLARIKQEMATEVAGAMVGRLRTMGLSFRQVIDLVSRAYEEDEV